MLSDFENLIGYVFTDKNLLKQALTHSSYSYEKKSSHISNNERLEFLGDAVLELIVSSFLFKMFPEMPEGELTKFRANLVCEHSLAEKARRIGLGDYLYLSKGEELSNGRCRDSILADAFEAVTGAIFLDGGFPSSLRFIQGLISGEIKNTYMTFRTSDHKTYLQEVIQKFSKEPLIYTIIGEEGPDHDKTFFASVSHLDKLLGQGKGKSKKEAEQNAAFNAINCLKN